MAPPRGNRRGRKATAEVVHRKLNAQMEYLITPPAKLRTTVKLPASKSISNRALIIYALSDCCIMPDNLSNCDDTEVIIRALRDNPAVIDIGAAGTAMRFTTAYLAATASGEHLLTGTERMKHRPISILVDALRRSSRTSRRTSSTSTRRRRSSAVRAASSPKCPAR